MRNLVHPVGPYVSDWQQHHVCKYAPWAFFANPRVNILSSSYIPYMFDAPSLWLILIGFFMLRIWSSEPVVIMYSRVCMPASLYPRPIWQARSANVWVPMDRLFCVAPHPLTTSNVAWRQCRQKKIVRPQMGVATSPKPKELSAAIEAQMYGRSDCCSDCCTSACNILSKFQLRKWCTGFACATFSWCFATSCSFAFSSGSLEGLLLLGAAYERHMFETLLWFKSWWDSGAAEVQGGSCAYHVHTSS